MPLECPARRECLCLPGGFGLTRLSQSDSLQGLWTTWYQFQSPEELITKGISQTSRRGWGLAGSHTGSTWSSAIKTANTEDSGELAWLAKLRVHCHTLWWEGGNTTRRDNQKHCIWRRLQLCPMHPFPWLILLEAFPCNKPVMKNVKFSVSSVSPSRELFNLKMVKGVPLIYKLVLEVRIVL